MTKFSNLLSPQVSILMTVYNRDFLRVKRALDSVLKQDFIDFEMIIIDDGSSLELGKHLLEYALNAEDRVKYIRHKNRGQAASINRAIINSRGSFIGLIDSDDEYKSNHISECLKQINKGYDLIASTTETVVGKEEDYFVPDKSNENHNIHIDECIVFGTLFGKHEVFATIGFSNVFSLDSDLFEKASKLYKTKKLDLKTYIYYLGSPDSIVTKKKKMRDD